MRIFRGIAVSRGVTIAPALVLGSENFRIPQRFVSVDVVETEVSRFQDAFDQVCLEIEQNEKVASAQLGNQYGAIFAAHLQLARDKKLRQEIESLIREKCHSPEYAVSKVLRNYAKMFENLGDRYLAERAVDLHDLEKRLLRQMLGDRREELTNLTQPVLILAHNLTPSETATLDRSFVKGFATELGGHTSHTAILAGALEIPAVVGLGDFLSDIAGGETVVIDGNHGEVIIDPDEETLDRYRRSEAEFKTMHQRLESQTQLPAVTTDSLEIQVQGNIEFPEEVDQCVRYGATGIGLYRTEFLYLSGDKEPTEEDHYQAYRRVVAPNPDLPVTIRTLDLGADKLPRSMRALSREMDNPFLGLRSLRLSLQNLPLFKTQLRAILRAAVHGNIRIMFPLVSTLLELRQAKMILADVIEDLEYQGVPFAREVPVGMMVEVPSAALLADEFAREVDFFSIGTNDLIQYTLAVDRSNTQVAHLFSSGDPSVLKLLERIVNAARRASIPVTVCGQMSSDPIYSALLLGLGVRQLSVTPHVIPEIKEVIRHLSITQAEGIAAHALTLDVARDVESYLRGELKKIFPDLMM